jgi:hypothetical protein
MLLLDFQRLKDLTILFCNLRIVGRSIVDIAQNGQRFFATAVLVEVAR